MKRTQTHNQTYALKSGLFVQCLSLIDWLVLIDNRFYKVYRTHLRMKMRRTTTKTDEQKYASSRCVKWQLDMYVWMTASTSYKCVDHHRIHRCLASFIKRHITCRVDTSNVASMKNFKWAATAAKKESSFYRKYAGNPVLHQFCSCSTYRSFSRARSHLCARTDCECDCDHCAYMYSRQCSRWFWLSGYDSGSCLTWLHICSTLCLSSLFVALLNAYMRAHLIYRWIQSQSLEKWNIKKEIHTNCIRFFVLCILLLHHVCPFIEQVSLFINLYILLVCIVDMNICQIDSTTREKKIWHFHRNYGHIFPPVSLLTIYVNVDAHLNI